jgi:molecular chaperone DnaJ
MTTRTELIDALDRLVAPFEEPGESKTPPQAALSPLGRGPHDATVVVSLSNAEARSGTKRVIGIETSEPCSRCDGTGVGGPRKRPCRRCNGIGSEAVERTLRLSIPPDVKHGTELLVRGEGRYGATDEVPGDLYVRVEVNV